MFLLIACASFESKDASPELGETSPGDTAVDTGDTPVDTHADESAADSDHESGDSPPDDTGASTLRGKLLMGYQGWFSCEGDGGAIGWSHWAAGATPTADNVSFDAWPDLTELGADELCPTAMTYADGSNAALYSAWNADTVDRHFAWMEAYGIDGVLLQRFGSELGDDGRRTYRDRVTQNVMAAAEAHGRSFALMYDLSGMADEGLADTLAADWRHLVDDLGLVDSPAYLFESGTPVVGLWGFGFTDRPGTPAEAQTLLATWRGGDRYSAWVLGGTPTYWRTLSADSQSDEAWMSVYLAYDALSPWAVGRFGDEAGADDFRRDLLEPDLEVTRAAGIVYVPVVFPGFSWTNLTGHRDPLNQIPRQGGRFYWRQVYNAVDAGADVLFNAMFDEVDEGTAMMKVAAHRTDLPTTGTFLSLDADGYELPSDWYLQLGGEATRMLRGERPLVADMPLDPGSPNASWYTWVVAHAYRGILDREADEAGADGYEAALASGLSVGELTTAFWSSAEFQSTRASLSSETLATDLYEGILERAPDPEGLAATVSAIDGGQGAERAAAMLEGEEARALWGG